MVSALLSLEPQCYHMLMQVQSSIAYMRSRKFQGMICPTTPMPSCKVCTWCGPSAGTVRPRILSVQPQEFLHTKVSPNDHYIFGEYFIPFYPFISLVLFFLFYFIFEKSNIFLTYALNYFKYIHHVLKEK